MIAGFYNKVRDRAYFKYLDRRNKGLPDNTCKDWLDAEKEELLNEKKEQEAFFHFLKYGGNSQNNWNFADYTVKERIKFIAFNIHEKNFAKKEDEVWEEAEDIYARNF